MKPAIVIAFAANARAWVFVAALTVIMQIQACALTEEQKIHQEALREERVYRIRFFIDKCIDSGGKVRGPGVNHGDPPKEIPKGVSLKYYRCKDLASVGESGPPSEPTPNRQPEPRMK